MRNTKSPLIALDYEEAAAVLEGNANRLVKNATGAYVSPGWVARRCLTHKA